MNPPRLLSATAILAVVTLAFARPTTAQTSEYFLMTGDQSTFHVIQGGVLLRSWSPAPGTAQYQYAMAITDSIRSLGANVSDIGAQYDFNGTDLGLRYTHPAGPARAWDGTTDGSFNYCIDGSGGIYRFNPDWTNPTLLFTAGSIGALTYDPTNNSMWVSQFSTTMVTNYTMAGVVISSFSTGHTQNMALALDHADGTLWLHDRTATGTFEQWSKTGTLLNRIAVPGMSTQNALGGEFALGNFASCTFRNGNGINPADYSCVTRPVLGTTWTTSFNSNVNTVLTAMVLAPGGAATGPSPWSGEVLVALAPRVLLVTGSGNISLPIPNNQSLAGYSLATQGFRLDIAGSNLAYVLLNAQDIHLGM